MIRAAEIGEALPGQAEELDALVIGAGPAGLMAAEELSLAGRKVVVCEAKPSPARKFLMAGKSGLNLTRDEPPGVFAAAYDPPDWLAPMLDLFGPAEVRAFCERLGQPVFTGSSGRVFPVAMKGSPLLRAWLERLAASGAALRTRWQWQGFTGDALRFGTPEGERLLRARVMVLALGGASWTRLGSDAAWVPWLTEKGVGIAAWKPANMGMRVSWSAHMARHFGQPVKGGELIAGERRSRGEFVVSARGLEGGGIYAISQAVREGAPLELDLLPDLSADTVRARWQAMRAGESVANRLRKLGLSPAAVALVMEFGRTDPLAAVKRLELRHDGPRPLDEAISVAGGIRREAVSNDLELLACPGIFVAGEMLDWEAPTGGYLLTGCFASGRWAGRAAARQMSAPPG